MTEDPFKKVPTQDQVRRIKDRFEMCRYFYRGIFLTRRNVLPLVLKEKLSNEQASSKVENVIDTFYSCMTENKFNGVQGLPPASKKQLSLVKAEIIDQLAPESFCEYNIDKLYRDLFYQKLI